MTTCPVPGCVRTDEHEVHVPELATEENGLLPRRRKPERKKPQATRFDDFDPTTAL